MNMTELNKILEKHKKWLNREVDGERANLYGANLYMADLYRANLYMANLSGANLYGANLSGANLSGANLSEANLLWADLNEANLSKTNLSGANLREANLHGADLSEADLSEANLRGADLSGAGLHGVDLRGVDLSGANLYKANLYGALNIPDYVCPINCPQKGSFIGFKKAHIITEAGESHQNVIVKLRIPVDAKRSSATTRKCRCDKAEVISITSIDGNTEFEEACSIYDNTFIYKTGEIVSVDDFDENRWNECSTGIHFFITREEAVNY